MGVGQCDEMIATLADGRRYHVYHISFQHGQVMSLDDDNAPLERGDVDTLVLAARQEWQRICAQEKVYRAERRAAGNPLPKGCCKRCGIYCGSDCQAD
jgi:hypothetical protein